MAVSCHKATLPTCGNFHTTSVNAARARESDGLKTVSVPGEGLAANRVARSRRELPRMHGKQTS